MARVVAIVMNCMVELVLQQEQKRKANQKREPLKVFIESGEGNRIKMECASSNSNEVGAVWIHKLVEPHTDATEHMMRSTKATKKTCQGGR
jgi:hypothetical protein